MKTSLEECPSASMPEVFQFQYRNQATKEIYLLDNASGAFEMNSIRHNKIVVKHFGGPEALTLITTELPPPGKGYARLKVLAIGTGYTDVVARRGEYLLDHKRPLTPGYELVGEVLDFNEDPSAPKPAWLQPGVRVAVCLPRMGAYTEYISLPFESLVPVPTGMDIYQAAAIPLNYLTALSLLERHGKVKQGDSILIHGASGGVGEAVCQLGKMQELKMYGTASAQNASRLEAYSVRLIDYHQDDFEAILRREEPLGLKAVFDSIGGNYLLKSYRLLSRKGVLVSYGFMGRAGKIYVDTLTGALLNMLLGKLPGSKRTAICSVPNEIKTDNAWYRNSLTRLLELTAEHKLTPTIAEVFSLKDASAAHIMMESKAQPGKILLKGT
jgi:NADPH2:quinone reductase